MKLPLLVLLVVLWLPLLCDSAIVSSTQSVQRKKYLLADSGQNVSTYQAYVHARSKIDCVRTCRRFSHCTSLVFEKSSNVCYLNPDITSSGDRSVHLYKDAEPPCDVHAMPHVNNGAVTVWNRTLTKLEGDVTCNEDFMENTVSGRVKVHCTGNGAWERDGECLQYIFRNPIPRPVREGWSVCVEATPTANTRFSINFKTVSGNIALHSDYRFSYRQRTRVTILNKFQDSAWGDEVSVTYFPFVVAQAFKLQITLMTNTSWEIKLNGQFYANFTNTTPSPPQTAFVEVHFNVTIQFLNVWCHL